MAVEYGILETRRVRNKKGLNKLEDEINHLAKMGWRVKCSIGTRIILIRKI